MRSQCRARRRGGLGLAGVLRTVERLVGGVEEVGRRGVLLKLRDAARDAELLGLADRRLRDRILDPREQQMGVGESGLGQDHRELVAADPAGDVRGAHRALDAFGRNREDLVPGQMADPVVDLLEVVQVDHDQGERPVVAARAGDLALERLVEEPPVVHAGERVEVGQLSRLAKAAGILDRRRGPFGELFEPVQLIGAEAVAPLVAVDGEEAEAPGAVRKRHSEPAVDPRLVVLTLRLFAGLVIGVAERELDRTMLFASAAARHVQRQLDRLGRQPRGSEDRRSVLRLQRDEGCVRPGEPSRGFERPREHLVQLDRLGDLVQERAPAPLLLGLAGRVGEVAGELVEAGLEPRGERSDAFAFAPPGAPADAHDGDDQQSNGDACRDGDARKHGLAQDQPARQQFAQLHVRKDHPTRTGKLKPGSGGRQAKASGCHVLGWLRGSPDP